ncbi:MAG: Gfo/Idh/MocA family oxidoreductase [Acidobacteria bacterium]|nr:Gfo/Idh/MocA family oxidoreductase [Acidobacteriota bacterium]MCI0623664.1 Gfo/Idh/MocA family oxidoreductase [Acidobacteriota bacterium]MCI0723212.1 Gfo/Idh/MocA family oxidoreductase [Acidobacteriota bacterium]
MNSRELKGVIAGAGFFAGFQAEAWKRIPQVQIVAVADPVEEKAREFADRWQIAAAYSDAESMLQRERPDFVDIATRPDTHLPLVELAARSGAQVICQKPMALSWQECLAMVEACRQTGVRLLIHENWRWQPWYREIKRLLEEELFGRLFHLSFQMRTGDGRGPEPYSVQPYFRQMERFLLQETVVHFLDTFRFLAGEIETVFCQTQHLNPLIRGEDCVLVQISFNSGAHGLIDANRISGPNPPEVAFGTFTLEGEHVAIRMTPRGDLWVTEYGKPERLQEFPRTDQGYKGDSVKAVQEHFVSCLQTGQMSETEGVEYLKTVAAVFACYQSAETGNMISLNG